MLRLKIAALSLLLSVSATSALQAQDKGQPPIQTQRADGVPVQIGADWVSEPVVPERLQFDPRSRPLIRPWQPGDPIKEIPRRHPGDPALIGGREPVNPVYQGTDPLAELQRAIGGQRAPDGAGFATTLVNQNGLGFTGVSPSDVNGDVGADHYILSINGSGGAIYIIYNKADGSVAAGPFNMEGLGTGNCAQGLGDAIILYDDMAQRWLLTEFSDAGNDLCVYVSSTSNPVTSSWSRYSFLPANSFPDYPKYGVWSDAYYVGTNQGNSTRPICAMDRARMIAGLSATLQCFTVPTLSGFGFQMLQPIDHDGADAPPAGANGTFIRHRDDESHNPGSNNPTQDFLELFELDINWATPASSTRTGPINIPISEFDSNLNGLTSFNAFPQPNGQRLDPLREPVMFRAAYRNFGTHEALIGNLVTDVDGADTGGIRWFELRRTGGTASPWTLFQEGTYSLGDGADRWMGGIAMDASGNMALGYSITRQSPGINPSLRYVGRLAGDAPGVMTTSENPIVSGTGSQGNERWGDYHSMSIDPVDGCTFWFAGNYISGSSWNTRVASFKHDECGEPNFALDANNLDQQVCAMGAGTPLTPITVNVASLNGFSTAVQMTFGAGLPSGFSGGYSVNPVNPPGSTVANISVANSAPVGANVVTLRGSAPGVDDQDLILNVDVSTVSPATPGLLAPADGAINVAFQPVFSWSGVAQAASYTLEVATDMGFSNIVASASVAGTSHQFPSNLAAATTFYWRVRASNGCGTSANSSTRSFTTLSTPDQCPAGSSASNVFFDNVESGTNGWATSPSTGSSTRRWSQSTIRAFSPATSWRGGPATVVSDQLLTSPSIALPAGGAALTLQFQHYRDIEEDTGGTICYDGGRLEISVAGGAYTPIPEAQILVDPYTNLVSSGFSNPLAGERAWCGFQPFTLAVVDLSPYAGNSVNLRFRHATDSSATEEGWFVDDIKVQNCTVATAPTTTVLGAAPDPSVFGQSVTLTATVTSGSGTPAGNVQFRNGAVALGAPVALNGSGVATLMTSALPVGPLTLHADYAGNATYAASTDSEAQTVNQADTTTAISSDNPDASVVGQAVTVVYAVTPTAPGAGTPSGNVTVTVSGGAESCTGTVAAGSCNITLTSAGSRTLTATYAGDSNFVGSAGSEPHTVNPAGTTTSITADIPDASVVGQAVAVNFSVVATAPGAGTPSGTVTITASGGAESCSASVAAGSCNITLTSAGSRTLTASYAGDANFNGSSDDEPHTVNPAATTTSILSDDPDPSVVGQTVTVTYNVVASAPGAGSPSGNVTVTVSGGAESCVGTVAAGSCDIILTSAGARILTATYAGDANFNGSATAETHQVNGASTTTSITSHNPDPSVVGQAVSVLFSVTSGAGTPTGNVTVTASGGAESCTGTVAAGSCAITLTSAGTRTLTATYAGDANFSGSSGTASHTVNPAATTTLITADNPEPSAVGQAVTVSYSVTSAGGSLGGNVTVTVSGGAESCTGTVAAGSCDITLNSSGARTLTATYAGDGNFAGSSDTELHQVDPAASTTTITAHNPDPSVVGQAVSVTYSVTSAAGTPSGNVTVTVSGGAESCTGTVAAGSCAITLTSAGTRTLTASYAGDANFAGSSGSASHTVNPAATTTSITAHTPNPSVSGQAVAVSFSVLATAPGAGSPSGTVTVTVSGGGESCTGTVAAGSCAIALTSVGTRTLTATYGGDGNFNGSAGTASHTVNPAATTTTISAHAPDPSTVGAAVAVSFSVVANAPGSGSPSGNVTVTVSGGSESCTGTVAAGSCSITFTSAGARTLTATYAGNSNFNGSAGTAGHTVNPAATATSITADDPDPSAVGQAVTVNYSVTSAGGSPSGNVTVTVSGGSESCTGTVAAGSCTITLNSAGSRTLTATYAGDVDFAGSSDTELHQVDPATSTTTITADNPEPSVVGQAVTVEYSVSSAAGTPTGTVTVTVSGGAENCTGTVAAGSCEITLNSSGARILTATYAGDSNFAGSADSEAHQVNAAPTVTTITANNPDPSVVGQAVAVSYTVTSAGGTPSGSVVVSVSGGTESCTGTVAAGGCVLTLTSAGARTLTASYGGSANFAGSVDSQSHTVNPAATTLSISDSPDPSAVGQTVTISAVLAVSAPGAGSPTGIISVSGTDTAGCVITLPASQCDLSFTAAGMKTISAAYAGDGNFQSSSATPITHSVGATADLAVTKSNGRNNAPEGAQLFYHIVLTNLGPDSIAGATLVDNPPATLGNVSWVCSATPPAICPVASGSGAINQSVDLGVGESLNYTLTATVTSNIGATVVNTASVSVSANDSDPVSANNQATDSDPVVPEELLIDGYESP